MCISVELKNWMSAASIQDTLYMFKEGKGNSAWLVYFGTRVNILHTPTTHIILTNCHGNTVIIVTVLPS